MPTGLGVDFLEVELYLRMKAMEPGVARSWTLMLDCVDLIDGAGLQLRGWVGKRVTQEHGC